MYLKSKCNVYYNYILYSRRYTNCTSNTAPHVPTFSAKASHITTTTITQVTTHWLHTRGYIGNKMIQLKKNCYSINNIYAIVYMYISCEIEKFGQYTKFPLSTCFKMPTTRCEYFITDTGRNQISKRVVSIYGFLVAEWFNVLFLLVGLLRFV